MVGGLIRTLLVVIYGLLVFMPGWGGAWLLIGWWPASPAPATLGLLALCILLVAILPLTKNVFVLSTSLLLMGMLGILIYQGVMTGSPVFSGTWMIAWFIVCVGIILGWVMNAPRLYRWIRGTIVVDTGHDHHN